MTDKEYFAFWAERGEDPYHRTINTWNGPVYKWDADIAKKIKQVPNITYVTAIKGQPIDDEIDHLVMEASVINYFIRPINSHVNRNGKMTIEQLKHNLSVPEVVYRIVKSLNKIGTFSISFDHDGMCYQFWKT